MCLEIDSWVPHSIAPFLTKAEHYPKVFEGIEGQRLKTIRLRGQIPQGLLLPMSVLHGLEEKETLAETLGVIKWEKPLPANLSGFVKGNFPTHLVPKTDQERVQNLSKYFPMKAYSKFEVSEKLDGSSMTIYLYEGEFGVCSRNLELKETEGNAFWDVVRKEDIERKVREFHAFWRDDHYAFQGELIGDGVQGNKYKLPTSHREFRVYSVYNISQKRYVQPEFTRSMVEDCGLNYVPVYDTGSFIEGLTIKDFVSKYDGIKSLLNPKVLAEGVVLKSTFGYFTFKVISNTWLLKNGE